MRLPAFPRALLTVDTVVVKRPASTMDADGNHVGALATLAGITRGTYTTPTGADLAEAGQRSTRIDAVVVFVPGTDIRADDQLTVRGAVFAVVATVDARNRVRALIRRITPP